MSGKKPEPDLLQSPYQAGTTGTGILFLATAGLVLAQVVDPATAQKIAEILAGLAP